MSQSVKGLKINYEALAEYIGADRLIELIGLKKVVDEKGIDWLLKKLSPAQRRELKQRLK